METNIAVFKGKEIRKTLQNNEWWFVVEDVVMALIESSDPKQYIQRMKQRDPELGKGWVQIVHTLLIDTSGGKARKDLEQKTGKRVVSRENYLTTPQGIKKIGRE